METIISRILIPTRSKMLIIGLLVLAVVVLFAVFSSGKDATVVTISGMNALRAPEERKVAISQTLYNVLQENLPKDKKQSVNDATVRENSYVDNYDPLTDLHHASFIIDIPSISQSYIAYYEWSGKSNNPNLSGYPVTIVCLPKEMLKYGEFDCKPMNISETADSPDIIYRYLPYRVESKYTVTSIVFDENGYTTLSIEAYLPRWMSEITSELLSEYTTEIQQWIISKGLDPNNYRLDFGG